MRRTCIFKTILAISIILVVLGIAAKWIVSPFVIQNVVWQEMELKEGTLGHEYWVSSR